MFAELFQQVKWAVFLRKPHQNLEYRRIQLLRIRLESVILIQQRVEKEWENEHKATTAATQARTMAKRWKNYQDREEVQYNNWHLRQGQI